MAGEGVTMEGGEGEASAMVLTMGMRESGGKYFCKKLNEG